MPRDTQWRDEEAASPEPRRRTQEDQALPGAVGPARERPLLWEHCSCPSVKCPLPQGRRGRRPFHTHLEPEECSCPPQRKARGAHVGVCTHTLRAEGLACGGARATVTARTQTGAAGESSLGHWWWILGSSEGRKEGTVVPAQTAVTRAQQARLRGRSGGTRHLLLFPSRAQGQPSPRTGSSATSLWAFSAAASEKTWLSKPEPVFKSAALLDHEALQQRVAKKR